MAKIEVNHKTLREVAAAITDYCSVQDREMRLADTEIKAMLKTEWTGPDAQQFSSKWDGVDAKDSTAGKLCESLKSFADGLKVSADLYQTAQENAYNAAYRLPK